MKNIQLDNCPSELVKLLEDGIKNKLFQIKDNEITYIAQNFTDNLADEEEKIRAALFYDLVKKYGYKNKKEIIDFEFNRIIGHPYKKTSSKIDIIVYRQDKTPYAIFELKSEQDYDKYYEDSIKTQLFERAANEDKSKGYVKYLIYYTRFYEDGELNEKFVTIDYSLYKTWDDWEESGRPNLRVIPQNYGIIDKPPQFISGSKYQAHMLRASVRKYELDRIAEDLTNVLWGGGQHQNELFYNLIGLFLTKIYDEKTTRASKAYRFQIFYNGDKSELPEEVYHRINKMYRGEWDEENSTYSDCALKYLIGFNDEKLKKTPDIVFNANKVKYVVEALQEISFTSNKYDVLGDFFQKIVRSELKQTKGQYLTHHNIVDFIVKAIDVENLAIDLINGKEGRPRLPYIIDPSCGSGTYQIQCMKEITRSILSDMDKREKIQIADDIDDFLSVNFPKHKQNAWAKDYIWNRNIS